MANDHRSPQEIEDEIERERAELTETLSDLQDKISFDGLTRQVADQVREHSSEIGHSISDAVKRNPIALALTGVGIAWLMMGNGATPRRDGIRSHRTGDREHDRDERYGYYARPDIAESTGHWQTRERHDGETVRRVRVRDRDVPSWARTHPDMSDERSGISEKAGAASARVASAASSASSEAQDVAHTVADKARDAAYSVSQAGQSAASGARNMVSSGSEQAAALRERISEGTEHLSDEARERVIAARERAIEARDAALHYARRGRDKAIDLFDENPLIAGALALAVGAAVGAALPRSRVEDEYLGEHSDHLMDEAERIFREESEKVSKVVKAGTDEAKAIARERKAEADAAAPADTAAEAAANKAKASGKRIADAAGAEAKKS
jgi:hypothetical protein